jgi:hypothetical protein
MNDGGERYPLWVTKLVEAKNLDEILRSAQDDKDG